MSTEKLSITTVENNEKFAIVLSQLITNLSPSDLLSLQNEAVAYVKNTANNLQGKPVFEIVDVKVSFSSQELPKIKELAFKSEAEKVGFTEYMNTFAAIYTIMQPGLAGMFYAFVSNSARLSGIKTPLLQARDQESALASITTKFVPTLPTKS